ncbi:restriction endonuclease subunit S [Pseudotamlana carrageenivorans]|nr:restriction endonuclease subunit S [Tamlana carrageenivorans]
MREGWEVKTLDEICEKIFAGGDKPKDSFSEIKTEEYNVPIYANGEKNKGLYGYTKKPRVLKPSITVSARGTIGYSEIRREPFYPIVRLIVLTPNLNCTFSEFLQYFLGGLDFKNSGTSIPQLTVPMIKKYKIPIPPLQEQQQIVAILDKAFKAIDQAKANIEKNIENAKELFQSKLNAIFSQKGDGWEEKTLGEVVKYDKTKYSATNRPYVGLENIESNTGTYLGSLEAHEVKSSTFQFDERHVLYGRLRPYLNKVLVPKFAGHCSTEIFPILPGQEVLREFLFYWLMSPLIVSKIDATWTGARMPRANMNEVIKFKINITSIENQKEIIKELTLLKIEIKNLESKYKNLINNIEELKKSILQKAFAGELTSKEVVV